MLIAAFLVIGITLLLAYALTHLPRPAVDA